MVLSSVDTPLMVRDDAVHDSEAQPGSAPLGGKIWLKKLLQITRRNAAAGIRDLGDDQVACDVVASRDRYARMSAVVSRSPDTSG